MNFSISVTIGLDEYDTKVQEYCQDNQYDAPDYTTLIDRIQEELEQIDGVEQVMFNHSSWMVVDLGTDDFDAAKTDVQALKSEISAIFKKHGVE